MTAQPVPRWRLRVCFSKTGHLRFISHLDFIRAFERAARRAGLPLAYSEGFSPAPRIAYGWPLPVGMTGLSEYLDVELTERVPPEKVAADLNRVLPEGLAVRDAAYVSPHGPSLMSEFDVASFLARTEDGGRSLEEWRAAAGRLMARDRLPVTREKGGAERGGAGRGSAGRGAAGRKGPSHRTVDVRPLVRRLEVREVSGGEAAVFMELWMTERGTARPEEIVALLRAELGLAGGPGANGDQAPTGPAGRLASVARLGLRHEGRAPG